MGEEWGGTAAIIASVEGLQDAEQEEEGEGAVEEEGRDAVCQTAAAVEVVLCRCA